MLPPSRRCSTGGFATLPAGPAVGVPTHGDTLLRPTRDPVDLSGALIVEAGTDAAPAPTVVAERPMSADESGTTTPAPGVAPRRRRRRGRGRRGGGDATAAGPG